MLSTISPVSRSQKRSVTAAASCGEAFSTCGKVSAGPVKTYEVYPSVEPGNTYKRLVAVDGVPLKPEELARGDRIHREDVLREAARRERETPQERQKGPSAACASM